MKKWIYLDDYKIQCPKCFRVIEHKKAPKRCPNCGEEMANGFGRLFPQNNLPQKKEVNNGRN